MVSKRGQSGGTAAGLVAIIALFIVVYLLLLPSDVRDDLLNGTTTSGTSSRTTLSSEDLVFEHPGTLDPLTNTDREKALDSFNLYSDKSAVVLESIPSIHIENGWFTTQEYNLTFSVADAANTENYVLAFDVAQAIGRVELYLNGKQIYDGQLATGNAEPIELDADTIAEQNSLYMKVSGVGVAFWRINEYELKNVRVIADFTDVSKREYKNFFIVSATEKENIEKTKLTFVPDCLTKKVGPLHVTINGRTLNYAAIPDCGLLSTIEFDPSLLQQGENVITFNADEGNYFVDRVTLKFELKDLKFPFYYFELKDDVMRKVSNNTANVSLELAFADRDDKTGEINVNGHLSRLETDNATYTKVINAFVQEGQNYVQIKPISTLNIVDLKVVLKKK